MPPRKTPSAFDPARFAARLSEEQSQNYEMLMAEIRRSSDSSMTQIVGLREDVRRLGLKDFTLEQRIADIELQVITTREAAQRAPAAIGPAVAPAVERAMAAKTQQITKAQRWGLGGVGAIVLLTFAEKAPKLVAVAEGFWTFMKGLGK